MSHEHLLEQVRELRARGQSPKQIARALGLRPAEVAPLVRQVAGSLRPAVQQPLPDPADRELVGCWINPGWSRGLGLQDAPHWQDADPEGDSDALGGGLAGVMVARADRSSRVTLCAFLVDVFCLGVKNTVGPLTVSSSAVTERSRRFFSAFDINPRSVPLELARDVVHGAVDYARTLGFEPYPEFADTAPYLGPAPAPSPIRFGHHGKPFYISGPHDDPRAVMATLQRTTGTGNFDVISHVGPDWLT